MRQWFQKLFGLGKKRKSAVRPRQAQRVLKRLQATCLRETVMREIKAGAGPS